MIHPITGKPIPQEVLDTSEIRFRYDKPGRPQSTERPKSFTRDKMMVFIRGYIEQFCMFPSVREITDACYISSTSVVDYNLKRLVQEGRLELIKGGAARAYRIPGMRVVFE